MDFHRISLQDKEWVEQLLSWSDYNSCTWRDLSDKTWRQIREEVLE